MRRRPPQPTPRPMQEALANIDWVPATRGVMYRRGPGFCTRLRFLLPFGIRCRLVQIHPRPHFRTSTKHTKYHIQMDYEIRVRASAAVIILARIPHVSPVPKAGGPPPPPKHTRHRLQMEIRPHRIIQTLLPKKRLLSLIGGN